MPVSVMIPKIALEKIGGFHQDYGSPSVDYSTFIRLFELPGKVIWTAQILGYWRQSTAQTTQKIGLEIAESTLRIALDHYEHMPPGMASMVALKKQEIISSHNYWLVMPSYFRRVRSALQRKEKRTAMMYGRKLIRYGTPKRKLQGIYALIAAPLGLNMEPILSTYTHLVSRRRA